MNVPDGGQKQLTQVKAHELAAAQSAERRRRGSTLGVKTGSAMYKFFYL
jgi:hypothetical protein